MTEVVRRRHSSREDKNIQDKIDELVLSMIKSRKKKKITQGQLSAMTEIPQATISRIESFKTVPTLPVLLNIADKLNLTLELQEMIIQREEALEMGD